jgi:ABC-type branched-subunit amino acid transport system substrate-binding protein
MDSTVKSRYRRRAGSALAIPLVLLASAACAQGVAEPPLMIGQTVALSGAIGDHGRALTLGAQIYFDKVNGSGGVHGRKLALVTLDDAADSKRAQENARQLIVEQRVLALFSGAEGGPCVATTTLGSELRVPVVGCAGGSPELREPFSPFSFPVRASHLDEFEKLLEYAALYGWKRLGFVHSDSDTGRKHLANVQRISERHGVVVALPVTLRSGKDGFDPARVASDIGNARLDAVLNHGSYGQYAEIIRAAKKQGIRTQFLAVNSGAQQMVQLLGSDAVGLIFAQVVPFPWAPLIPIVREYHGALKSHAPQSAPSFSSLEGFINAKVLVEGLRRAGRKPSREGLIGALESMRDHDVGGLWISYAAGSYQGSRFVDVVVVGASGRFAR